VELNRIVVCMLTVGVIALALDRLMRFALSRAMPWAAP
jgi:ABC-type nitrate/sulfonate/bicarbonate transport system permease component